MEKQNYKLSYYVTATEKFNKRKNILLFSARSAKSMLLSAEVYHQILEQNFEFIQDNLFLNLIKLKILVLSEEDELKEIVKIFKEEKENPTDLQFVIQPSANCQLGCGYCGQKHENKNISVNISDQIIERFKNKITANPQLKSVNIGWFGAEPLIGLKQIEYLSPPLIKIAAENNLEYSAVIVSNGLLFTPNHFQTLVDLKVNKFEITIDGSKEFHDITRVKKIGSGSFETIFNNVKSVVQYKQANRIKNVTISIRHNVNRFNQPSVLPFLDLLAQNNLLPFVSYNIQPVHSWGNDAHLSSLSHQEFADFQIQILKKMEQLGSFINWLPRDTTKYTCTATRKQDEVIDTYGNIHRCTEIPYVKTYGDYKTNNQALTTFISPHDEAFEDWYNILLRKEYDCGTCKILPICGGSCPKAWKEGNAPCPSTKYNLKDKILQAFIQEIKTKIVPEYA